MLFQIRMVIISILRSDVVKNIKNDIFKTIADKIIFRMKNYSRLFNSDIITEIVFNSLNDHGQSNVRPKLISQLFLTASPREITKNKIKINY